MLKLLLKTTQKIISLEDYAIEVSCGVGKTLTMPWSRKFNPVRPTKKQEKNNRNATKSRDNE
jgi:hypothetical protein